MLSSMVRLLKCSARTCMIIKEGKKKSRLSQNKDSPLGVILRRLDPRRIHTKHLREWISRLICHLLHHLCGPGVSGHWSGTRETGQRRKRASNVQLGTWIKVVNKRRDGKHKDSLERRGRADRKKEKKMKLGREWMRGNCFVTEVQDKNSIFLKGASFLWLKC